MTRALHHLERLVGRLVCAFLSHAWTTCWDGSRVYATCDRCGVEERGAQA